MSKTILRGPRNFRRMKTSGPKSKRRRVSKKDKVSVDQFTVVPAAELEHLVTHDNQTYMKWKKLYHCVYSEEWRDEYLLENSRPTEKTPASVQLSPRISLHSIWCEELVLMSDQNELPSDIPVPCISCDLLRTFLAFTHSFTVVGLEPQATAFSHAETGVIKYLALLPQINRVTEVCSRESDLSEVNAVKNFHKMERRSPDDYCSRCWIHTHPCFKAFMSAIDIIQLYYNACLNPHSFGIVLSPKKRGVKALCVALTDLGLHTVEMLIKKG